MMVIIAAAATCVAVVTLWSYLTSCFERSLQHCGLVLIFLALWAQASASRFFNIGRLSVTVIGTITVYTQNKLQSLQESYQI